jgi:hypothetical protein
MRRRALILAGLIALLALAIAGGCSHGAADKTQPAWTIPSVRRALEAQGLHLLPTRQAGFLGPSTVPEKVRLGDNGRHIVGYVVAQHGSVLSRRSPGYVIVVTVFDSAEAREDAVKAEPRWVIMSSRRVRTAQIDKNNLVATYGGRETEDGLAELREALSANSLGQDSVALHG